ncbi:MAG: penicillin-binding protein 2 [Candidatus Aminicenantes bacterium]|nr:MAG: penicillin-binding protein 2 [Candidatus Aminicenantes bacterium]
MYIEKRKLTKEITRKISAVGRTILVVLFLVLLSVFWSIQVLKNHYYTALANRNITKDIEIKAPRGLIVDRDYNRLSENKLKFTLFLVREDTQDLEKSIDAASSITGMEKKDIIAKIEKYKHYPGSFMIPLQKELPRGKAIYIESRSDELPEFRIEIEPARAYPYKKIASHLLGYISELTAEELEEKKSKGYKPGDIIGKSGIEKQYESALRGTKGIRTVAKDNLGRVREIFEEKKPIIGSTVVLTINIELQKFVEELFKDYNGIVGIVELKTGDILAMVSKPNFSPEFFSGVLDPEEWLSLVNDPDRPLHNKFIQGKYSPGSVFKIVVALAGLQEKVIDTATISYCPGAIKVYDRTFQCWKASGHGALNLVGAIKNSCNVFFYRLGKKLDVDTIAQYARWFGLGDKTAIDLPGENQGLIPTKAWKLETYQQKWFPGETISVAIGGGMVSITPVQVLQMISTVALRGKKPTMHLLKRIENNGKVVKEFKPRFETVPIDEKNFEIVIRGLYQVVNNGGTGRAAKIPGLDICGKTGTQQIISKENPNYYKLVKQKQFKPHSWFVSFAPKDNPEIAMVIFVENGGDAGAVAAPLAKKIYREIF